MPAPTAAERLIVALDVPDAGEARAIVAELEGVVGFYKVGLELLMSGGIHELLVSIGREHRLFADLKLAGDIPETVRRVVGLAAARGVRFLTLSASSDETTVAAAVSGRAGGELPRLLFVSFLSSMDRKDFASITGGQESEFEPWLLARAERMLRAGCDGFIASGRLIGLLRARHPGAVIVSPGIRPKGSPTDDHKRSATPAEAIGMGADYLVVGRPITRAPDRKAAAAAIIAEIGEALRG